MRKVATLAFALVFAVVAGGCAYAGSDDPIFRKLSWFSYLNGDDIRKQCVAGAPERYRFVYNGIYTEQVRTYDMVPGQGGGEHVMRSRALGKAYVNEIDLSDILGPWRGKSGRVALSDAARSDLFKAMKADGVFDGAPKGLELHSDDFYWIVGACSGGAFHFTAYRWPSKEFQALSFPRILLAMDATHVVFNPPRKTTTFGLYGTNHPETEGVIQFNLRVGENGLDGVANWF